MLLDKTDFDINQVIRNTASTFEGTCHNKSIAIEMILTGNEMYVHADMGKIQQVLYNLMDNAIKFSKPEGKQAASVSVKEATLIEAVKAYFTLPEAPEGEIAYQSVNGTAYPESKTVIFDAANATAGTMKRRGRKKAA